MYYYTYTKYDENIQRSESDSDSEEWLAQRAQAKSGPKDRATAATTMVAGQKEAAAELR